MIKHIVMWKFKDFAQGRSKQENIALVKSMLEELPGKIDFIRSLEVHPNVNMKESMYDAILVTTFDNLEDVARYKVHPDHKAISTYVSLVREGRAAVDYEI